LILGCEKFIQVAKRLEVLTGGTQVTT
jgi:hypothetical protein